MAESPYLSGGGLGYRAYLADLAAQARENPARPTQDPMKDWVPPSSADRTAEPSPQIVSEDPDETDSDARIVTYDDGSRWLWWTEFDPGTERLESHCVEVTQP